jgi:type I site-specific restriction-modification system R (restriction) subunit
VTEQSINDPGASLAISDVVIVCDKLDTGYNEPLLACMYIDRVLRSSSQTVQLLSRLNRRHPRTFVGIERSMWVCVNG